MTSLVMRRDRTGQVLGAAGDGQLWTAPTEPPLLEPALQHDHESARAAVVVGCAALPWSPPGQHDLDLVVDTQDRPGVRLTVVRVARPSRPVQASHVGHPRQQFGPGGLSPDGDTGERVEQRFQSGERRRAGRVRCEIVVMSQR